jgi:uncharacterized repeat protein (TIGR04076 family)
MSSDKPKCKITVLKRMLNQDLAEAYLDTEEEVVACNVLSEGQEFMVDGAFQMPEGFCPWAWADIRHDLMTVFVGGDPPWMKQRGTVITGCTDWFRPVIFKVERIT